MVATTIFIFGSAALLYILLGYPLLLAALVKRTARPVARGKTLRSVSVVLAVRDGGAFLRQKLESLFAMDYPRHLVETIVVSDGSTDNTVAIAQEYARMGVAVIEVPRGGKPSALNAGVAAASNEILMFTDVRQRLDPYAIQRLIAPFDDASVGVVSGELIIMNSEHQSENDVALYRRYENWIRNQLARLDSIFGATGCLYAMRRELAVPIPPDMLLDDMYLPLSAFFRGYRLIFEADAKAFDFPTALDVEFWRKVRTLAGNFQIIQAYPGILGPANRMWFHFVSYKFGRLLMPWFILAVFASSLFLPDFARTPVLAGEAVVCLMALADPLIPGTYSRLKRLTSPVRTFFTLAAATLCAVLIFFVPARKLWKETRVAASGQT